MRRFRQAINPYSSGRGIIHLTEDEFDETSHEGIDVLTLCGCRIGAVTLVHKADDDRRCKRCWQGLRVLTPEPSDGSAGGGNMEP